MTEVQNSHGKNEDRKGSHSCKHKLRTVITFSTCLVLAGRG